LKTQVSCVHKTTVVLRTVLVYWEFKFLCDGSCEWIGDLSSVDPSPPIYTTNRSLTGNPEPRDVNYTAILCWQTTLPSFTTSFLLLPPVARATYVHQLCNSVERAGSASVESISYTVLVRTDMTADVSATTMQARVRPRQASRPD
jgi:hypothetical protein